MLKYTTKRQEKLVDDDDVKVTRQCSFVSSQVGPSKASVIFKHVSFPLAWPAEEYFDNRGEWREFKVVLVLRSDDGQEITSDPLEKINRTFSDLKFNQTFIFNNLSPEFSIEAILYAQRSDENAVPTIVQSVSRSLGRRFGLSLKRYMGSSNTINSKFFIEEEEEETKDPQDETRMFRELIPIGRTVFRLQNASLSGMIRVYQLQTEWPELMNRRVPKSALLPIFGNICCQIFVQPNSLVQPLAQGALDLYFIDDRLLLQQLSCVLQGGFLKCYNPNSNTTMSNSSPISIPIDENTEVDLTGFQTALKITLHDSKGDFQKRLMIIASSQSSFLGWKEAIKLQILDCQTWKEFASLNHNTFSLKSMGGLNLSLRNSISRYAQQFGTLPVIASDTRKFLQEQGFDLPIYRRSRRPLSTVFPKQNNAKETTPDESQLNHMTKKRRPESDVLPNTYVINLKIGLSDDDVDEIDSETLRKISSSTKPIPIVVSETESKSSISSSSSSVSFSSPRVTTSRTNLSSSLVNKIKQDEINRELSSTLPKVIRTKVPPPIPPKPSIVRSPPPPSSSPRSYKPPVPPRKLPPSQSFTQPIRMYNYTSDITVTRL